MHNVGLYTFRRRLRSYLYDTRAALHHHHIHRRPHPTKTTTDVVTASNDMKLLAHSNAIVIGRYDDFVGLDADGLYHRSPMFMIVVAAAAATVAPASYAVSETAEKATSPWGPRAVAVAQVSSWTVAVR